MQKLASDMCEHSCLNQIQYNRIVLALDEMFANIHEHGYAGQGGEIDCSARWLSSDEKGCLLEMVLRDFAPVVKCLSACHGIEPETLKDNPVPGGLGMNLIHAITDKFEHEPLKDGNKWRMVFNLQKEKEIKNEPSDCC